jgi:general stress protein YciG
VRKAANEEMARAAKKGGLALGGEDDEEEAEEAGACAVSEADEGAPSRSDAVACIIN